MAASVSITNWASVAMSADGTKMVAVSGRNYSPGPIYTSANSGVTWTSAVGVLGFWEAVASSADGTKLVAAEYPGLISTSADSGATWTITTAPRQWWHSVASSADGTRLAAVIGGFSSGPIFTSSDSGATWTTGTAPKWGGRAAVTSSADGSHLLAAAGGPSVTGPIYISQFTALPELAIAPVGSNSVISWTVPSMDFVLQQNSDLTTTNWTDVTTPPVLNLTNLQNQVIVSPTNRASFYRLKH
jgi:hypothetical protein